MSADSLELLRRHSPYLAACLEHSLRVKASADRIKILLESGDAREALGAALESRLLVGRSVIPDVLMAECYLACGMTDAASALLLATISGAMYRGDEPQVYLSNSADLALPLLARVMAQTGDPQAIVEIAQDRHGRQDGNGGQEAGVVGDRGILETASALRVMGQLDSAQTLYEDIFRHSRVPAVKTSAQSSLLSICLDRGQTLRAASLVLETAKSSGGAGLCSGSPLPLGLLASSTALLDAPHDRRRSLDLESRLLYCLGRREEALERLNAYRSEFKDDTRLLEDMACHAWDQWDLEVADRCVDEVLSCSLPLGNARFLSVVARRLAMVKDFAQAIETFGLALRADPSDEDALAGVREMGPRVKHAETVESLRGAGSRRDLGDGSSYHHLMAARRHSSRGEYREARIEALLSISLTDSPPEEALSLLAECYAHLGMYREARLVEEAGSSPDAPLGEDSRMPAHLQVPVDVAQSGRPSLGGVPRVLIATPVRQKPAILREFLLGLERLETTRTGGLLDQSPASGPAGRCESSGAASVSADFLFLDDNDNPESTRLLRSFVPSGGKVFVCPMASDGKTYVCDKTMHRWTGDLIDKMAVVKDFIIEFAVANEYDSLFLVDSDLVLHPGTLMRLLWTGREIISEVFWTNWQPGGPTLPQVWLRDNYDMTRFGGDEQWDKEEANRRAARFIASLRTPGTYEVGGLGACTLIKAECLKAGLRFRKLDNLTLQGEDRFFCVRAKALGYSLHAETTYPPLHLYREEDLTRVAGFWDDVKGGKARLTAWPATDASGSVRPVKRRTGRARSKLTLSMLVRNEAGRYLREVLADASHYVDQAVILDDASDDGTAGVCREVLESAGVPHLVVSKGSRLLQ